MSERTWYDKLFHESAAEGELADVVLAPTTVESLERQLNEVSPRHVQVAVASERFGTGAMCTSRFWGAAAQGAAAGADLMAHLLTPLICTQMFVVQHRWRAWPSPDRIDRKEWELDLPAAMGRLPLPGCAVEQNFARLWFGAFDQPVLSLTPVPLS